jgi:sialidase-1
MNKKIFSFFILLLSSSFLFAQQHKLSSSAFHVQRSSMQNSFLKFTQEKTGRVAFMGGSITEGGGWRDSVCAHLQQKFPYTKFEFINAGISSTGSTPGAFRLKDEVLAKGTIDLFFEEAAVNDRTNGFNDVAQIRGMEGIIRHMRLANPTADIIMMHCVDPDKIKDYNDGHVPNEIANHEKVAEHYKANTINWAKEVTDRINAKEFTWKADFKDLHPSPFGHKLYAGSLNDFLDAAYELALKETQIKPHAIPDMLDAFSYAGGNYTSINQATSLTGWKIIDRWKPTDGAGTRKQYVNIPALVAENPGDALKFKFKGSAVGICIASGPDAGIIEYSIDGQDFQSVDLFTQWSGGLHLPWYIMLNDELKNKKHTLQIRMSSENNKKSKGHACRILHFLVNE